jgi:hypothetical protein
VIAGRHKLRSGQHALTVPSDRSGAGRLRVPHPSRVPAVGKGETELFRTARALGRSRSLLAFADPRNDLDVVTLRIFKCLNDVLRRPWSSLQ